MNHSCCVATSQLIWLCSQSGVFRIMSVIAPNRFIEPTNSTEPNWVSNDPLFWKVVFVCSTLNPLSPWATLESGENLLSP